MSTPFTLAASAEMLFLELPFEDRLRSIHAVGLEAEIWDWTTKDLDSLAATGVPITSMTGYITGELIDPDGAKEILRTATASLEAAERISCPRLNLHGTGLDPHGLPVRPTPVVTGADWLAAMRTLEALADLAERAGRTFTLENLNLLVDHPGVPFGPARDTLALVRAIDHPHLRLNLDLYHAQIGEGNLIELVREALPWIGEVQVADVPGRCEPGTGEINYPAIASALHDARYTGTVAMEAFASTDSFLALERFIRAFTVQRTGQPTSPLEFTTQRAMHPEAMQLKRSVERVGQPVVLDQRHHVSLGSDAARRIQRWDGPARRGERVRRAERCQIVFCPWRSLTSNDPPPRLRTNSAPPRLPIPVSGGTTPTTWPL